MAKSDESPDSTNAAGVAREPYFLVNHIGRSRLTKGMRKSRAGYRRQGILLADGTRIRKKGRRRRNILSAEKLLANWEKIYDLSERGIIEIQDPVTERPIPIDQLGVALGAATQPPAPSLASEENGVDAPEVAPPEGYTEEQLLAMSRKALNRIAAREFGVNEPDKLPNKAAVIEAIMAAGGQE